MLSRTKKLFLTLLLSVFLLTNLLVPTAKAQGALDDTIWYAPSFGVFVQKVYDTNNPTEIFGERYTQAQVTWIIHSLTAMIYPDFILECMAKENPVTKGTCIGDAFLATFGSLPGAYNIEDPTLASSVDYVTRTSPASGVGYVKNKLTNIHVIEEVHAQGFGFNSLNSVQNLWAAIRDIAYFLMVLAFIAMAFMIMFRMRLSPQTVVSVQSALPKLVITLILITFSYAIAGFIIDLAYLSIGLLALAFSSVSGMDSIELFQKLLTTLPIFSIFFMSMIIPLLILIVPGAVAIFGGPVGATFLLIAAFPLLILLVAFLIILLRIFWLFIRSAVMIIIFVIFSPIMLLLGAFPGPGGFGTWLRGLVSHLAVFPAVIIMVFMAHFLFWNSVDDVVLGGFFGGVLGLDSYDLMTVGGGAGDNPINFPGFEFGSNLMFGFMTSFAILFMIPRVGNMIQSFMSGRPFNFGAELGAAVGGAARLGPVNVGGALGAGAQRQFFERGGMLAQRLSVDPDSGEFRQGVRGALGRFFMGTAERRGGIIKTRDGPYRRPGE